MHRAAPTRIFLCRNWCAEARRAVGKGLRIFVRVAAAGMYVSVLFYEGFHVFAVATGFASRFHVSYKGNGPHISVGHSTSGWELTVFKRCIRAP